MTETVSPRPAMTDTWLDRIHNSRVLPAIVLASALVLAYGYEVFSFNLTIDEDLTSTVGSFERAGWSVAEGRWGMALLTLFLANPIAPVVSNGIGIALSGVAWWILAHRLLRMPPWHAATAAAVGGTIPVLAFIFSFSTIAFAIGVGNLLLVAFFCGLMSRSWWLRALAVLAAAAAIAIYDTFLVAIAAAALGAIVRRPTLATAALAFGATVLSLGLSRGIGLVVSLVTNEPQSGYTGAFFDIAGLIDTPRLRAESAARDVWGVVSLSTERFPISSPWLAIGVMLLLAAAVYGLVVWRAPRRESVIRALAVAAVIALPFCVEAVASVVVLRSMFYLPIVVIVLASVASVGIVQLAPRPRITAEIVLAVVLALAVIGNATVTNRSFSIAATTYSLDTNLAFDIGQAKDLLADGDNQRDMPIVVAGVHSWPEGVFTSSRETLGLSLFGLSAGRTTEFLRAHGVLVHRASAEEADDVEDTVRSMPVYPNEGWIAVDNGVLIIKFDQDAELSD